MKPLEPTTPTDGWPGRLIALLESQQRVVDRLLELSRYQSALIEKGKSEPLLGLLSQRQKLIDEFTSLQGEFAAMTDDLERRLDTIADDTRKRIKSLIDVIGARLGDVMRQDELDQRALAAARDDVKRELASQGTARQARHAYTSRGAPASRFADRQG